LEEANDDPAQIGLPKWTLHGRDLLPEAATSGVQGADGRQDRVLE
jgi:hypothetical protein